MRLFKLLILILVLNVILYSQENTEGGEQIHRVPFLSSGNVIELSVKNVSEQSLSGIKINVIDAPSWMSFKSKQKTLADSVISLKNEAFEKTKDAINRYHQWLAKQNAKDSPGNPGPLEVSAYQAGWLKTLEVIDTIKLRWHIK